ncbi:MAG: hypothetical protein QOC81_3222 [Thermoanaerobaculia bacterium]|jgi:hypothetical protein|nr:hypothetical protein [Thermoanaerobaculia bacterium]
MDASDRAPSSHDLSYPISRRLFAGTLPLLAVGLASCTGAFLDRTRFAEAFIVDPDWTAYRPILGGLIRIILPLDQHDFPKVPAEMIEERLISMFPLEKEQKFLGLQRTLTLFDQIDLFPIVSGPLLFEEEKARDGGTGAAELAAALQDADRRAYQEFTRLQPVKGRPRFQDLSIETQQAYYTLWRDSPSVVKRAFHSTMKTLIMTTFYSMDQVWPAIGYAGPLLGKAAR